MGVKGYIQELEVSKIVVFKKVPPLYHSLDISEISLHSSSEVKIPSLIIIFNEINFILIPFQTELTFL